MTVAAILKHKGRNVHTLDPGTTIMDAAKMLNSEKVGAVVVSTDGSRIEGILSERDIVTALARSGPKILDDIISTIMTEKVRTCHLDDRALTVMTMMTEHRIRHVPVTENDVMVGLVSIGDIVKRRLEEIESDASAMRDYIAGNV